MRGACCPKPSPAAGKRVRLDWELPGRPARPDADDRKGELPAISFVEHDVRSAFPNASLPRRLQIRLPPRRAGEPEHRNWMAEKCAGSRKKGDRRTPGRARSILRPLAVQRFLPPSCFLSFLSASFGFRMNGQPALADRDRPGPRTSLSWFRGRSDGGPAGPPYPQQVVTEA